MFACMVLVAYGMLLVVLLVLATVSLRKLNELTHQIDEFTVLLTPPHADRSKYYQRTILRICLQTLLELREHHGKTPPERGGPD